MKNLVEIKRQNPYFYVLWALNNVCNFDCSYCTKINKAGNHKIDIDSAKALVDNIFDQYFEHNLFNFNFTGGEPTIWPHFIELCEYIKSKEDNYKRVEITVNTNFSRSYDWWNKNIHLFNLVLASFQIEYANQEEFLRKVELGNRTVMTIRLSMYKDKFWDVVEFGNKLIEKPGFYRIEWVPLFDVLGVGTSEYEYTDPKQIEFLERHAKSIMKRDTSPKRMANHGFETLCIYGDGSESFIVCNDIIAQKQNYFKGWNCRLGLDSIFISFEGDIEGATCRLRKLGSVHDKVFIHPEEPLVCPKDYCHCGADIMIPKKKGEYR